MAEDTNNVNALESDVGTDDGVRGVQDEDSFSKELRSKVQAVIDADNGVEEVEKKPSVKVKDVKEAKKWDKKEKANKKAAESQNTASETGKLEAGSKEISVELVAKALKAGIDAEELETYTKEALEAVIAFSERQPKRVQAENNKTEVQQLREELAEMKQARVAETRNKDLDTAFTEYSAQLGNMFGEGSLDNVDGIQAEARAQVVDLMDIIMAGMDTKGYEINIKDAMKYAVNALFADYRVDVGKMALLDKARNIKGTFMNKPQSRSDVHSTKEDAAVAAVKRILEKNKVA